MKKMAVEGGDWVKTKPKLLQIVEVTHLVDVCYVDKAIQHFHLLFSCVGVLRYRKRRGRGERTGESSQARPEEGILLLVW